VSSNGYLVKLVRDDVDEMLGGDGTVTYRPMSRDEHERRLRRKLVEEAIEYALEPSLEELADVYEAVLALSKLSHGGSWGTIMDVAEKKRHRRGGFDRGMGMYARHPADDFQTP
jgi:predicted house-cleaning noncanonical NTP pyrophosphatase (MazG superfamily)